MSIRKTNGKKASKTVHKYAETIMETSTVISWKMDRRTKENYLNSSYSPEEISKMSDVDVNHYTAVEFALDTWYGGFYSDYNVDDSSLLEYFINYGSLVQYFLGSKR